MSSIALIASLNAAAGLGGLQVNSNLGEPFSGSVTVTGSEAKALASGTKVNLYNSNIKATVKKTGDDRAVVTLTSSSAVNDPVLVFQMGVGSQTRQYTAILDPKDYVSAKSSTRAEVVQNKNTDMPRKVQSQNNASVDSKTTATVARTQAAPSKTEKRLGVKAAKGQHIVQQGETLTEIATRIRPENMTTAQAMQQLVRANPKIFTGGDANRIIYPGDALSVPFATAAIKDTTTPTESVTPPVKEVPGAENIAASATGPASAVVTEVITTPASVPEIASTPVASAPAETASVPVVVAPTQQVDQQAEGGSKWRYLLWGSLGLIALLILSRLLGKKNTPIAPVATQEKQEADPFADEDNIHVTPATTAIVTTAVAEETDHEDDDLIVDDDFDSDDADGIFFESATGKDIQTEEGQEERLNLDLNDLDKQQSTILTGAVTQDAETAQRKNVDWEKLESTESIYEQEPTSTREPIHLKTDVVEPEHHISSFENVKTEQLAAADALEFTTSAEASVEQVENTEWVNTDSGEGAISISDTDNFVDDLDIGDAEHVIEWGGSLEASDLTEEVTHSTESFVSESVGMTAPLEAKYELAEMYVEIGDPEAARETLKELLEESDGGILTRAQALLDKLDA